MLIALLLAAAPQAWPPPLLSKTGLFSGAPETLAAEVRPFSPQYPLWTDGAKKRRWIRLPRGAAIEARDPEAWVFPAGTRLWKEFAFDGRKVETRFMEKDTKGTWRFATYAWNEAQTDAELVERAGRKGVAELGPGVFHDLPSEADCRACHEGSSRDAVLGYDALQLSQDRDPGAPHQEPLPDGALNLGALLAEKRLRHAPAAWAEKPPVVAARTPTARSALGYLHGNCWGCHNEKDAVSSVGMSLRVSLLASSEAEQPAVRTAVGVRSRFQTPGVESEQCKRIIPGDAERSAVLFRVRSRNPLRQMPPLGSKLVDDEGVAVLSRWVTELNVSGQSN